MTQVSEGYGNLFARMKPGKPVGVCQVCGRVLTDPASIEAGMGPECAAKTGGFLAEGAEEDGEDEANG